MTSAGYLGRTDIVISRGTRVLEVDDARDGCTAHVRVRARVSFEVLR